MSFMKNKNYYLLYGLILSGIIAFIVFLGLADLDLRNSIMKEGGVVESMSAIGYFICIALLLYRRREKPNIKGYWQVILVLLIFGLRELDFHNRFTTMSFTKFNFYRSLDVPIIEKIIGGGVVLLFFYSVFYLVKNYFSIFIRAIKEINPAAVGMLFAALFLFMSEALDGLGRRLSGVGIGIGNNIDLLTKNIEEMVELGIPLMFIIAILACFYKSKRLSK